MIKTEQIVKLYENIEEAHIDIGNHLRRCWFVYTCVSDSLKVMVIYQRELCD